ncbi:hypothetical protein [uncultured Paludibaculum sp.]|uniref:hypothetical protein n=1 Tax=uncultured Paludibaculum sp. TaxID=1765020 RepID=UPI002AAA91AD|nr:hypothetical protein [uncultured Paludibaculum sp.]
MMSSTSEAPAWHSVALAELDRILQSRFLRESKQLCALLTHAVHETLAGREDGLKEYILGLQVFNRPPDYDPRNDAIVRVQASLLRKRLADYYEHEGSGSTLHIELPRGGYVVRFVDVSKDDPQPHIALPLGEPLLDQPVARGRYWPALVSGLALGTLLTTLVALWVTRDRWPRRLESPAVWGVVINSKAETVVSFGVPLFFAGANGFFVRDTSVNAVSEDSDRIKHLGDLLGGTFRPQEDVYTGIGDAIGTHYVADWLQHRGVTASVANSNYLGPSDIEGKNLVVVSSARFQTLLQQMQRPDLFPFDPGNGGPGSGFLVSSPLPGELPVYRPSGGVGVSTSYAVMSLWPGRQPNTRMLYLSGIETWSTQGAANYAIDPERLTDLQRRIDADPPNGPRGKKSPYFQVLIRVEGKNNRVRTSSYVTHRYLPGN